MRIIKGKKTFGKGRYSLRNRIRTLDHSIGEKAVYLYYKNGPQLERFD